MDSRDQLNQDVSTWAKLQQRKMAQQIAGMTLRDRRSLQKATAAAAKNQDGKPLDRSVGSSVKKSYGAVNRINFKMARYGIFYEIGVGRGRRKGTSAAKPHPFIKPILDPAIEDLANILAERYGDIVEGEIKFTVPGILSSRVKIEVK